MLTARHGRSQPLATDPAGIPAVDPKDGCAAPYYIDRRADVRYGGKIRTPHLHHDAGLTDPQRRTSAGGLPLSRQLVRRRVAQSQRTPRRGPGRSSSDPPPATTTADRPRRSPRAPDRPIERFDDEDAPGLVNRDEYAIPSVQTEAAAKVLRDRYDQLEPTVPDRDLKPRRLPSTRPFHLICRSTGPPI